jgi:uncharacterized OB-fold protein
VTVPRPFPYRDRDSAPFWEAQANHELKFQRCSQCQHVRYPVGPTCPQCRSFDFDWITSSGRGVIYSYTVVRHQTHPAFPVPYTIVLVALEEGPRLIAQLRAPEDKRVEIGAKVRVEWEELPEQDLPVFVPER